MRRSGRAVGIPVDPARVREARKAAGLSLADIARNDVSRTLIHFIEHGRSRPSRRVLELIAKRTGKPVTYFVTAEREAVEPDRSLSSMLTEAASLARRYSTNKRLNASDRQLIRLIELSARQAAALSRTIESKAG